MDGEIVVGLRKTDDFSHKLYYYANDCNETADVNTHVFLKILMHEIVRLELFFYIFSQIRYIDAFYENSFISCV